MTNDNPQATEFRLKLVHKPCMRVIASARTFIEELLLPLAGAEVASRVAMASHELLENIAKYASLGTASLVVVATPRSDGAMLIRVTSSNRAPPRMLSELAAIIDEVSKAPDPHALYLHYMEASVRRGHGSRLGLIRIRAEGEMALSFERAAGEIAIHAEIIAAGVQPTPPTAPTCA
jgi:hypothetical protein